MGQRGTPGGKVDGMKPTASVAGILFCTMSIQSAVGKPDHRVIVGLTGTTMYASKNCPSFEVNPEKLSTFMKGAGASDTDDTDSSDLAAAVKAERSLEAQGTPEVVCDVLWRRFGPNGSVGARLFRLK